MNTQNIETAIINECSDRTTTTENNKAIRIRSLLDDYKVAVLQEYTLSDTGMGYMTVDKKWEEN